MAIISSMLALGTQLPEIPLCDVVTGKPIVVASARPVLVAFICNHCPYVVHIRAKFLQIAHAAMHTGVSVVAINSNSIKSHPQDGPDAMRALAVAEAWGFPFAFDATQDIARAFDAQCTPEFYVFDAKHTLFYRGRMDASHPKNGEPVTGAELSAALSALSQGLPPPAVQHPSVGCGIKWEPQESLLEP